MSSLAAIVFAVMGGWTGLAILVGWATSRMGLNLKRTPPRRHLAVVREGEQ